jgi:exosortase/archaeosortase family protein
MSAFFLGEIFRFSIFVRCGLVFSSVLLALFGNFARATTLSLIASSYGVAAIEKWHDIAGYAILLTTIGTLWVVSYFYYRSCHSKLKAIQGEKEIPLEPLLIPKPVRSACLAVLATTLISLAGTEIWYRSHEQTPKSESQWTIQSGTSGTRSVPISDRTRRILFYPEGFSERFLDTGGRNWQFFYLRWPAGRTAIQALNIHDPRTCLASIGMVLDRQLPSITISVGDQTFRFRVFLFHDEGRPILVFHSIIAGGVAASNDSTITENLVDENYTLQGRWNVVRKGIRNRGQSLIEAAVWNTTDVSLAANELTKFLSSVMVVPSPVQQ